MLYEVITFLVLQFGLAVDAIGRHRTRPRITSYNVCYTKLLRAIGLPQVASKKKFPKPLGRRQIFGNPVGQNGIDPQGPDARGLDQMMDPVFDIIRAHHQRT